MHEHDDQKHQENVFVEFNVPILNELDFPKMYNKRNVWEMIIFVYKD